MRRHDDRVQRSIQGEHGEEDAHAGRHDGDGARSTVGSHTTNLVEVVARCEGEGHVFVEATPPDGAQTVVSREALEAISADVALLREETEPFHTPPPLTRKSSLISKT